MKKKIRIIFEGYLRGPLKKPLSMRKQLSRIITLCCVIAVCIQTVVMVGMLSNQYVRQERENIQFLLENSNRKIDSMFQCLGEMVLSIRHSVGLRIFFEEDSYNLESITEELKNAANLFSERNRVDSFEPFVEKIYLFNDSNTSVCNLYYPMTISEISKSQKDYESLYEVFKESGQDFYYQINEECLSLCMRLYDSEMESLGTCIFALNRNCIEANFRNLEKTEYYAWNLRQGEEILLGEDKISTHKNTKVIEHSIQIGFGLRTDAMVAEWVIYQSLGLTVVIILGIAIVLIILLSSIGHTMAIYYVQPLEMVAEKIKLVGKGNFDTKLEEYPIEEVQNISDTFNEMTDYIERLVKEVYETQLMAQQSQIRYLQAQMNPHFLFNVLSMIEMRAALNEDKEVQDMLYKLSRLYQGKIFRKNEHFIYLEEEMEIVDFYLSIQNNRFGEKITYSIYYDGNKKIYEKMMIPRLSIEPLVENAVCHGLEPKREKGHISISISCKENNLSVLIEDNGVGFEPEKIAEKKDDKNRSNVGLWNTNKMIHNLCGEQYGLEINSRVGEGTIVRVLLPIRNGEDYVEGNGR